MLGFTFGVTVHAVKTLLFANSCLKSWTLGLHCIERFQSHVKCARGGGRGYLIVSVITGTFIADSLSM